MSKKASEILARLNNSATMAARAQKETEKTAKQSAKSTELKDSDPAPSRLTWALYLANRSASKINGCAIMNDWHKQGLTVGEAKELIAEFNKVTGYIVKPKKSVKPDSPKKQKQAKKAAFSDILSGLSKDEIAALKLLLNS